MLSPVFEAELEDELGHRGAEYTVILDPADTRRRVTRTTHEPFRHVCRITMDLPDPDQGGAWVSWIGSGTLVAPNKVLTAAHNVYSRRYGGLARNVRVAPGKNGAGTGPRREPYGSVGATRLDTTAAYRSSSSSAAVAADNDYAVITLARRVDARQPRDPALGAEPLGWWRRIGPISDRILRRLRINNAGYPADPAPGYRGLYQWRAYNRVVNVTTDRMFYLNDTFGGQSGGPIWINWQGFRRIVGVHTNGFGQGQAERNSGVRINAGNLAVITGWVRN